MLVLGHADAAWPANCSPPLSPRPPIARARLMCGSSVEYTGANKGRDFTTGAIVNCIGRNVCDFSCSNGAYADVDVGSLKVCFIKTRPATARPSSARFWRSLTDMPTCWTAATGRTLAAPQNQGDQAMVQIHRPRRGPARLARRRDVYRLIQRTWDASERPHAREWQS